MKTRESKRWWSRIVPVHKKQRLGEVLVITEQKC
jgi:hypothetical protein